MDHSNLFEISGGHYSAIVSKEGAELLSFVDTRSGIEFIWQGEKKIWGRHAPILFPIIGRPVDSYFTVNGKRYERMPLHGFAMRKEFDVVRHDCSTIELKLVDNAETNEIWPFSFRFTVIWKMDDEGLHLDIITKNTGQDCMPFEIGFHPGFRVPFAKDDRYEDCYLEYEKPENAERSIADDHIIIGTEKYFSGTTKLDLTHNMYKEDSLIFRNISSRKLDLRSDNNSHGMTMDFVGFPNEILWANPEGNYICIEPLRGIFQPKGGTHELSEMDGMTLLKPGMTDSCRINISVF